MKLSIIIPTFNSIKTVAKTLESLSLVKTNDMEVIVVDGASNDGTTDLVKRSDVVDIFLSEQDSGIYDAMNKGLRLAQGYWIYFLGSDDVLLGDFSSAVHDLLDINTTYYGQVQLSVDGTIYSGKFNKLKLMLKNPCHQSIFYADSHLKLREFNLSYPLLSDYDLNISIWGGEYENVSYFSHVICLYNNQCGASSSQIDISFSLSKKRIILKNFGVFWLLCYGVSALCLRVLLFLPYFRTHWHKV